MRCSRAFFPCILAILWFFAAVVPLFAQTIEQLEQQMEAAYIDGQYPRTVELATGLLDRVKRELPDDRAAISTCHAYLGRALFQVSRAAEAETHFQSAIRIGANAQDVTKTDIAEIIQDLGGLYIVMGRYSDAMTLFSEAIKLHKEAGGDITAAHADINFRFAYLLIATGRFADGEKQALEARASARKLSDWTELDDTSIDLLLANLYIQQSRIDEAVPYANRCYDVRRRLLRDKHPDLLESAHVMGYLLEAQKEYDRAEEFFKFALDGYQTELGKKHHNVAEAQHDLAQLYQKTGRNEEAEVLYRQCLETATGLYGPNHPELAWVYNGLGEMLLARTEIDEAAKMAEMANEVGMNDRTTPMQRFRTKSLLAEIAWRSGNHEEAIALMKDAFDFAELQRGRLGGGELGRARHFAEYAKAFERMIQWGAELNDMNLAFMAIERSRARTLLDQIKLSGADLLDGVDPSIAQPLREKERNAANHVASTERKLRDVAENTTLSEDAREQQQSTLLAELQAARQAYVEAYNELRDASPIYKLALKTLEPMSLDALKQWCNKHESLLLEYFIGNDGGYVLIAGPDIEPKLVALKVNASQASALGIEPGPLTEELLAAALIDEDNTGILQRLRNAKKTEDAKQIAPALAALWEVLIPETQRKEIVEGKYKRLHVIPSGTLALLPLETLVVEQTDDNTKYLLDVGPPIVYGPSATVLSNLSEREAGSNSMKAVLSVGDPAYTKPAAGGTMTAGQRYTTRGGVLSRLPFTDWEVKWVTDLLGKHGWIVQHLLRENSTEANFRRLAPGKGMIHVACHGLVDQSQSHGNLFGALALTPANSRSAADDGFLTLAEINQLNLRGCNLAILSACETNIGPQQEGEGVWALSRGFLVAGSQRVMASNWLVDDEAGASLVSLFCSVLAKQDTEKHAVDYAEALHQARRSLRKQEKWQSPYYWGGFVLLGPE